MQSAAGRTVLPMRAPQLGASAVVARPDGGVLAFGVVSGTLATAALLADGRLDPSYGYGSAGRQQPPAHRARVATGQVDPTLGGRER